MPSMVETAVYDQSFLLDQLEMLNEGSALERFSGRLTLDRAGIFGSSWAAGIAMLSSWVDSRFKATVACVSHGDAPREIADQGLDLPIMFLDAEGEPSDQTIQNMRGPAYMLTLNGMTSFSVGDFGIWPGMSQDFHDNCVPPKNLVNAPLSTYAAVRW